MKILNAASLTTAILLGLAMDAQANPVATDLYGISGRIELWAIIAPFAMLIEFLAVRRLLSPQVKFRHILVAFIFINAITFPITQMLGLMFGWLAEIFPLAIEPMMYQRHMDKFGVAVPNLSRKIIGANLVSFFVGVVAYTVIQYTILPNRTPETARRISCASNLKQIGLALRMYSSDWNEHYPPYDGAAGLELLRSQGYLENHKIYTCFSTTTTGKDGDALTEATVDYVYQGGLTEASSVDSPVAWDKPGNHNKYGNVLFVDGHVTGYAGTGWMQSAGIK
jgi:prepilin-type processing-associated H-X9-DG protein